jgi:hypothetical protein
MRQFMITASLAVFSACSGINDKRAQEPENTFEWKDHEIVGYWRSTEKSVQEVCDDILVSGAFPVELGRTYVTEAYFNDGTHSSGLFWTIDTLEAQQYDHPKGTQTIKKSSENQAGTHWELLDISAGNMTLTPLTTGMSTSYHRIRMSQSEFEQNEAIRQACIEDCVCDVSMPDL